MAVTYSTLTDINPIKICQNPFWTVLIDSKDHVNHSKQNLADWHRSNTCNTSTYNGNALIGLSKKSSVTSVDLTKDYYLSETGFYQIELRIGRHPNNSGYVSLYVDGNKIGDSIESYHQWDHMERMRYPIRWIKKGSHALKINLTNQSYVESIIIRKIDRYMASSDGGIDPRAEEINVNYFDFTQNSVNQINTGKIKMAMQDNFWNDRVEEDEKYLPMKLGFTDSITLILGPNRQTAIPMFGGYLLSPSPPSSTSTTPDLQIDFIDRLLDLKRNMVYHNFSIGTVSASDNTQKINYIKMGSVYELIRRLNETQEYPLYTYGVPQDYGFYLNFAGPNDFDTIPCSGWVPHRDPIHGQSPPCLKLTLPHYLPPGSNSLDAELILFNNPLYPWDAATYNMFFMHYYASGIGARYPIEFNLKFTMHKAGETIDDAQDYIVHVTGKDNLSNEIGDFQLIRDGTWREMSFDLDKLFDTKVPSSEYNISRVSLFGTITDDMVTNKKCSSIWLDNIMSYKKLQQAPQYAGQNNVKDGLGEINDVCDKTNHVAYTRPGIERCDDILVVLPEENQVSPVTLDETSNLITIESWKNDPYNNGYVNQSKISFNFDNNKSGSATYKDQDQIDHFGPFEKYDSASDINNQTDANNLVKTNVVDGKNTNKISFGATILGSSLLEIGQLMAANIISKRLTGTHKIATITQTMDLSKSPIFESKLDLDYPSPDYEQRMLMLNNHRELRNLGLTVSNQVYRNYGTMNLGNASTGTFSN